jgi:hypothetical protein
MARTAGKKQAPAKIEEDDDDAWDDAVVETDGKDAAADLRLRDWRDVERFREMKELRSLVDDDYGLEEIFHVPLKSRIDVPPRQPKVVPPSKLVAARGAKAAEVKLAAKTVAKPQVQAQAVKHAPAAKQVPAKKAAPAKAKAHPAKAHARVKPKAKRR